MTLTVVHHYHPISYIHIGASQADESPLEPGVFLIPAHATLTAPDSIPDEGKCNVWDQATHTWSLQDIPQTDTALPPIPEEMPEPIVQLRALRNQRLTDVDWVAIKYFTLGVPYPDEWSVYVQTLRDLPATVGPLEVDDEGRLIEASVNWPIQPLL